MPDLSHRPTRYATALVAAGLLATAAWPSVHQRLADGDRLASARAESAALRKQLDALRDQQDRAVAVKSNSDTAPKALRPAAHSVAPAQAASARRTVFSSPTVRAGSASCAKYPDQESAQTAYDAHHGALKALDGDGDGKACEQLKSKVATVVRVVGEPGAPTTKVSAPAAPKPMTYIPTKAALVASGHHFGLAAGTNEEIDQLQWSLGRQATMAGYFKGWDTAFDAAQVRSLWQRGDVPVMTWESRPLASTADTTDYSLSRIADGSFDDYLTSYAAAIKATGLPLVIRFDHEMNGNWYRWSEFESKYGVQVGDYVKAWRHVHDVFERAGANSLVAWLWSPNRIDNLGRFPAIDGYYPGDDYVDWVGMTAYFRIGDTDATFSGTFAKTLAALHRVAPSKPVFLSEVGATEDGGHKAAWMKTLWPGLTAQPGIAGLMWFNYAVTEDGHTNDWRLNSSPEVFDAFHTGLLAAPYGRALGAKPVFLPTSAPVPGLLSPRAAVLTSPSPTPTASPVASPSAAPVAVPSARPKATISSSPKATTSPSASPPAVLAPSASASPSAAGSPPSQEKRHRRRSSLPTDPATSEDATTRRDAVVAP